MNLFVDGGCVAANPSKIGGTWAWVQVEGHRRIQSSSGVVTPDTFGMETISNNVMELFAALTALENVGDAWDGILFTDSEMTRNRILHGARLNGIPPSLTSRLETALRRFRKIRCRLVAGHPTKKDLGRGYSLKHGHKREVSSHNVFVDGLCKLRGFKYQQALMEERFLQRG